MMDGNKVAKPKSRSSPLTYSRDSAEGGPIKEEPKKRAHRVSRACDFCHSRSIKCRPSESENAASCQSCIEYQRKCTYDRPAKKRGVKSSTAQPSNSSAIVDGEAGLPGTSTSDIRLGLPAGITQALVFDLVKAYFETVYPIYPIFHRQTLMIRLQRGEYNHDRAFYCALMALCALTMGRIRDGALFANPSRVDPAQLTHAQTFFEAAVTTKPKDTSAAEKNDVLRCCVMLALASLQDNNIKNMKLYLALFHGFVRVEELTDENKWPADITRVEVEERRCVFWSMYSLEIFCAACFGTIMAWRESHINVQYPSDVNDEDPHEEGGKSRRYSATTSGSSEGGMVPEEPTWLVGWNFVTDLYRVLEHAIDRRKRLEHPEQSHATRLFSQENFLASQHIILKDVMHRYERLPARFKQIRHITFNLVEDRYVFQSANIAATIQLVRMTLFTTEVATTDERCQIVTEVLQTFMETPVGCLKAMSTPLFYHLANIGTVLISAFRTPLCNSSYGKVRSLVLKLADLLASLESGPGDTELPSYKLRLQIERMDAYMRKEIASSRIAKRHGHTGGNMQFSVTDSARFADDSHHFEFPAEMMENWAWAFDVPQPGLDGT